MKFFILVLLMYVAPLSLASEQESLDLNKFAENYFAAWSATQSPKASAEDIETYLVFLADDVGHQHYPYDPEADRYPEAKADMREGMTYYLGGHDEYNSELTEIVPGFNVVVIKYDTSSKGTHPQTGEIIEQSYETVEVLELENGKVSVIRKYSD
jgi:hypothetical protein